MCFSSLYASISTVFQSANIRYNFSAVISCDQCVKVFPSSLKVAGVNMFQMEFDPSTRAILDNLLNKQFIWNFFNWRFFSI